MMAFLWPGIGIEQEGRRDRPVRKHIEKIPHISRMNQHVAHSLRPDFAQKRGDAVDEGLATDEADIRSPPGLMHEMFARPKADFQPDRTFPEKTGGIERLATGILLPVHPRNAEPRQIQRERGPLAGFQRLSMAPSIEIAPNHAFIAPASCHHPRRRRDPEAGLAASRS